jgi:hypothetical protein
MGRKPIHKPEELEVGEKMELTGKAKRFSWQYVYNFNKRGIGKYEHLRDGSKIYVERVK